MKQSQMMTKVEFAEYLKISMSTLNRDIANGMPILKAPGRNTKVTINVNEACAWKSDQARKSGGN